MTTNLTASDALTPDAPASGGPAPGGPALSDQAALLMSQVAGYVSHRTIEIGLRSGLIRAVAARPGATPDELAETLDYDEFYVAVWCRTAFAGGVLDRSGAGYRLAAHLDTLLLDDTSPAYLGGVFPLFLQPEMFDRFGASLATGERMWWNDASPEWIDGVSATGRPFYNRLVPGGLDQVPGLGERLRRGCRVADTACGAGVGLLKLAAAYPSCQLVGVDGDPQSIRRARAAVAGAGLTDCVELLVSPLEELRLDEPADVVINNISMHECRDIDQVTRAVMAALTPGGWFVISDFPFPDTDEGLRSVPGRVMSGIQFFEAQIDDQLLPRAAYTELLTRHGFTDIGSIDLTPTHALTFGRRPS
jgi:SAM-dependent methyltransferase